MITDRDLANYAAIGGCLVMILIVIYHFEITPIPGTKSASYVARVNKQEQ